MELSLFFHKTDLKDPNPDPHPADTDPHHCYEHYNLNTTVDDLEYCFIKKRKNKNVHRS